MEIALKNRQRTVPIRRQPLKRILHSLSSNPYFLSIVPKKLLIEGRLAPCELSLVFVNDKIMRSMNRDYRGKDRTTDVLSFPMYSPEELRCKDLHTTDSLLIGDIVISAPQALRQSKEQLVGIEEEIIRLIIHGLLHLLGYDHEVCKAGQRRMKRIEQRLMREIGPYEEMD